MGRVGDRRVLGTELVNWRDKRTNQFSISHFRSRFSEMESCHGRIISILDGQQNVVSSSPSNRAVSNWVSIDLQTQTRTLWINQMSQGAFRGQRIQPTTRCGLFGDVLTRGQTWFSPLYTLHRLSSWSWHDATRCADGIYTWRSNGRALCHSTRRLHRPWKRISRLPPPQRNLWS